MERLEDRALLSVDLGFAFAIGDAGLDGVYDVTADAVGNAYVAGYFQGTVDFDAGPDATSLTSAGSGDAFVAKYSPDGDLIWARAVGGVGNDNANTIAIDPAGNVYVGGIFQLTADFDPGPGTFNLNSNGGWDSFLMKLDTDGNFAWARSVGGGSNDFNGPIGVDSAGNVYQAIGPWSSSFDIDPGPGTDIRTKVGGGWDAFIMKLNSAGDFAWAGQIAGPHEEVIHDLVIDAADNVYLTGAFMGTTDFDPGPGTFNLTSAGNYDMYVAKLDNGGTLQRVDAFGSWGADVGNCLTLDAAGNLFAGGNFQNTVDFDPGPGTFNLTSAGGQDAVVFKLDNSGDFIWARGVGGPGADALGGLGIDNAGNVVVGGYFTGTADFDPGPGTFNLTSAGNSDIFVTQLDGDGNFVWAGRMGGPNHDGYGSLGAGPSGNVYLAGFFQGTADFDPGPGTVDLTSAGTQDAFLAQLTTNDPPVADTQNVTANEDAPKPITLTASDPDDDDVTFSIVSDPSHGTLSGFDGETGAVIYTPDPDYHGGDSFTFQVSDGTADSNVATVTVAVAAVADIVADDVEANEDSPVNADLLANDTFEDSAAYVSSVTQGSDGSVVIEGDGTVTYTPNADFHGTDSFTYTVTTSTPANTETATVAVTVLSPQQQIEEILIPQIEALVNSGVLNGGQGNSLISKLDGAQQKFDQGNINAGVNKMGAFINQVEAFIQSGKLAPEQGQALIDAAEAVIHSALPAAEAEVIDAAFADLSEGEPILASPLDDLISSGSSNGKGKGKK